MSFRPEAQPHTFEEAVDYVLALMRQTMIQRHKKYGPKNFLEAGAIGALRRGLQDKGNRLLRYYEREELRQKCLEAGMPQDVVDRYLPSLQDDYGDETLEDAHIDAGNYVTVIPLMLRWGWWTLPMEAEAQEQANR